MRWISSSIVALSIAFSAPPLHAQIQYRSGVDVTPAYEGWMRNQDGTFTLYFGYLNRNYEEELEIPVGPDNTVEPGGDRGQPTHFYPRRQHFVFKVVVAQDWGVERRVVWTLTIRGRTNAAKGWLQPEAGAKRQAARECYIDGHSPRRWASKAERAGKRRCWGWFENFLDPIPQ